MGELAVKSHAKSTRHKNLEQPKTQNTHSTSRDALQDHTLSSTIEKMSDSLSDEDISDQWIPQSSNSSATMEAREVPSQFLNMLSMPQNWEQVEKLKSKRQMLRNHLTSQMHSYTDTDIHIKEEKESDDEMIDVETVSETNDDSVTSKSLEVSIDEADDDSDGSLSSLKIVENEESDNDLEQNEMRECFQNILNSREQEKNCFNSRSLEASAASDKYVTKQAKKRVSKREKQTLDDKSDLCQLSATDISNSLFDTIASLNQQSLPKTKLKKQSSLETIITRIKSDADCNNSSSYHIQKPSVNESVPSVSSSKKEPEVSISSSKQMVSDADKQLKTLPLPKKLLKTNSELKISQSQIHLDTESLHLDENNENKETVKADSSIKDQEAKSSEMCPVKLKLKRYLKMQQNISDGKRKTIDHDMQEVQDIPEQTQTEQIQTNCGPADVEKSHIVINDETESDDKKNNGESQDAKTSSLDNFYLLKRKCLHNKLEMLKHEAKILDLKKQILEKENVRHYFGVIGHPIYNAARSRRYKRLAAGKEGWKNVLKDSFSQESGKQQMSLSDETSESHVSDPSLQEIMSENIFKQSSTGEQVKPTCNVSPNTETSSQHVEPKPNTEKNTKESPKSILNQPSRPSPNVEEEWSCKEDKESKEKQENDWKSTGQFVVKKVKDYDNKQLLKEASQNTPAQCQPVSISKQEEVPELQNIQKDQGLAIKQTKLSSVVKELAVSKFTHPVELLNPVSNSMDIKTGTVDRGQATLRTTSITSQRLISTMSKLSSIGSPATMYTCTPKSTGYQIFRPHNTINKPGVNSLHTGSVSNLSTFTTSPSQRVTVLPLNSPQVVQLQGSSADGRLYALVNNVLEPVVQKVHGRFVPVLTNPSLQRGMEHSKQTVITPNSIASSVLSPLNFLPTGRSVGVTSSTSSMPQTGLMSSMPHTGLIMRNSTVPCANGPHAETSINSDAESKVHNLVSKKLETGTSIVLDNIRNTPSNEKARPCHVFTLVPENSSKNESVTTAATVACTLSPSFNVPQKAIDKFVCGVGKKSLLTNQRNLEEMHEAVTVKVNMDDACGTKTPTSSAINVYAQSEEDSKHEEVEIEDQEKETVQPQQNSELTCPTVHNKSENQDFKRAANVQCSTTYAHSFTTCSGTSSTCLENNAIIRQDVARKAIKDNDQQSTEFVKETDLASRQSENKSSKFYQDSNNSLIPSGKEKHTGQKMNEQEKDEKANNSQALSEQAVDSEDSIDSIDWKRYEDTYKDIPLPAGNPHCYSLGKKPNVYTVRKTPANESDNGGILKIHLKTKGHNSVTPEDEIQNDLKDSSTQISDKEIPKKIVKSKVIVLKGDICDRWQRIKRKTFICEGLSDASFVHYLLNLEEMRQASYMAQMHRLSRKEKEEKKAGYTLDCVGDAAQTRAPAASDSRVPVMRREPRSTSYHEYTPSRSTKSDTERTPQKFSEEQSPPMVTRSTGKRSANRRPESHAQSIQSSTPVKPGIERNLKRKLEGSAKEMAETFASKKGKFEFLSETTKRQMSWALSVFMEWLEQRGEDAMTVYTRDSAWLDAQLCQFYMDARTLDGMPYPSRTLQTFRRALSMSLTMFSNEAKIQVGISLDPAFNSSNELLSRMPIGERKYGDGDQSEQTDSVSKTDLKKLYITKTLSDKDPESLSRKVLFDIVLYLCKPKMPEYFLESLEKDHLCLESDVNGVYYCLTGTGFEPDCESKMSGRMYATPADPDRCPVRTLSLYLSKLDKMCAALFQQPHADWSQLEGQWYLPLPLRNLVSHMETICTHAKLSKMYTLANVMATLKYKN